MDLTQAHDHPNAVLNRCAAQAYAEGKDERGNAYTTSVTRLLGYEAENDVTFVALDNATLRALRVEYSAGSTDEVVGLVNALLGLEDE